MESGIEIAEMGNILNRIVYVNGEYLPEEEAKISVFDRGFVFGDGVYEVVPVIAGHVVDKQYFLERLDRSLGELSISWPCTKQDYLEVMQQLVRRNELREGTVYSQVAFTSAMELLDNPAAETGIPVVTTEDLRWKRRDIKSVNLLAQVLAKQDAVSRGAQEGWMVEDGFVTEGVTSTAYIVKDGTVITRPLSNLILPGIRRRTLIEIAEKADIEIDQRAFTVAEALQADEAFISSATTITLAVVSIDGHDIGDGQPGPITMRLRELYKNRILDEAHQ
jgi:D-alanine transaminase